ncbi:MAG: peptidoglycan-binding protein [Microcoleus sp. CSU_2_2]|nr:peptidoglycan-binding protein [Microcoleus sp. CSU_2_2]
MDGLAYLHLAETWETPTSQLQETNSQTHLNLISTPLLFFTIALTIVNFVNPALALRRGDSGDEVAELQKTLQSAGYFRGRSTGFYGSVTDAAVRKFQAENNLKVDGIVGPKTSAALRIKPEETTSEPAIEIGPKVDGYSSPSPATESPDRLKDQTENQPQEPLSQNSVLPPFVTDKDNQEPLQEQPKIQPQEQPNKPVRPRQNNNGKMTLKKTIYGNISPKSIVHSGSGLFFAQNMMYSHTITVYDRNFKLVKTIPDTVKLANYGFSKFKGSHKGSPVEAAFSSDGKYAYVSNYQMYGSGFENPGSDRCSPRSKHDKSFLYRINTETLNIEQVIAVGAVPKFNAVSPDHRFVLATNWCSWDLSVVDTNKNREIERVKLGAYPRGIVVTPDSKSAYVAVMGSSDIAKVNLIDFSVEWLRNIGNAPRHLVIDPNGKYLYATLNGEGNVAKIDLQTSEVVDKVSTGNAPRSMAISDDGKLIYVVNYFSNSVSKVRTSDFKVLQTVNVNASPIGITYDPETNQVWVACYSGSIMVFQD